MTAQSKMMEEVLTMCDKMYKFALIGCGAIAKVHIDVIEALENAQAVGVYDKNAEFAQKFADEHGIRVFSTMEELLESDAETVAICTPSGLHASLAIRCMEAGKHVVVEKPIALTVEDCDRLLDVERATGKICSPISQLRFYEDIRRAKEILDQGLLGKPILCDLYMKYHRSREYYAGSSWRGTFAMDGGGALMNQGVHGIDVLHFLLGGITEVNGTVRTQVHNIEVEDTAVATVRFANGAIGVIEGTTSMHKGYPRKLEIHCEKGSMVIEENRIVAIDLDGFELTEGDGKYDSSSNPMNLSHTGHRRQYENFLAALDGKEPLFYSATDASCAVKTILAIYRSSKENKNISL